MADSNNQINTEAITKRGFTPLDLLGLFALAAGLIVASEAVVASLHNKPFIGMAIFALVFIVGGSAWVLAYALRPYTETREEELARIQKEVG